MSLLNFAYLWAVVLVVSAAFAAPFVVLGWRRAQWRVWELAGFVLPLGLWFGLAAYGGMPKSTSNFWIEVIRLTAAIPIAAGLRVLLSRLVSPQLLAVGVQVSLCLFAVGTYLLTPFCPSKVRPNMALQRTRGLSAAQVLWFAGCGSAVQGLPSGRSPLNAVALGLIRRIPHGVDALAVMIAFALTACSGGDSRFVDTRVAEDVYFIQEARKIERSGDSQATQEALCHAVRLTLEAGYDYWRTEPSGRSPQIKAEEGEEIVVWTIRMYRGVAPAADQKAFDARRMQHLMCERRSS